jgi:hypothetical protein
MKRSSAITLGVVALPALAIGWWLGSPLFLDHTVDEDFPVVVTQTTTVTTTTTIPAAEPGSSGGTLIEDTVDPSTGFPVAPSGPIPLVAGEFRDADQAHHGTGVATVYELENGNRVLRFEDLEVTNGPALRVYLVPHDDPTSRDDVAGYLDLGALKGNVGNQNYEIPPGVDLSQYGSIVIYCEPFHVIFSVAPLTDA